MTVRRYAVLPMTDGFVDFYELRLYGPDGTTRIVPNSGSVLPRVEHGSFASMFDNNPDTRCHTAKFIPFVDDINTPTGFARGEAVRRPCVADFVFDAPVEIVTIEIYVFDSAYRLPGLRFRMYDGNGTEIGRYDNSSRGNMIAVRHPEESTLTIRM